MIDERRKKSGNHTDPLGGPASERCEKEEKIEAGQWSEDHSFIHESVVESRSSSITVGAEEKRRPINE